MAGTSLASATHGQGKCPVTLKLVAVTSLVLWVSSVVYVHAVSYPTEPRGTFVLE